MCGMSSPDQYCDNSMHHLCPIELQVIATRIFNNPRRTAGYLWWSSSCILHGSSNPHYFNVAIPCYSWNLYRMQVCVNTLHMFIHSWLCDIWWNCSTQFLHVYFTSDPEKKALRRWVFSDKSFLTSSRWSFLRKGGWQCQDMDGFLWWMWLLCPLARLLGLNYTLRAVLFGTL